MPCDFDTARSQSLGTASRHSCFTNPQRAKVLVIESRRNPDGLGRLGEEAAMARRRTGWTGGTCLVTTRKASKQRRHRRAKSERARRKRKHGTKPKRAPVSFLRTPQSFSGKGHSARRRVRKDRPPRSTRSRARGLPSSRTRVACGTWRDIVAADSALHAKHRGAALSSAAGGDKACGHAGGGW